MYYVGSLQSVCGIVGRSVSAREAQPIFECSIAVGSLQLLAACINAAGGWIPPMYILAGENRKKDMLNEDVDGTACAMTESTDVNGNVFFYWLQFFVQEVGPARPQVLIIDGYFSHLNQRSVEFAVANDIKLVQVPSHMSYFLQPLDVGVVGGFKKFYESAISSFPARGGDALPMHDKIPALTRAAFLNAFKKTKTFFETGIFPFDVYL